MTFTAGKPYLAEGREATEDQAEDDRTWISVEERKVPYIPELPYPPVTSRVCKTILMIFYNI